MLYLKRFYSNNFTLGILTIDNTDNLFFTLELPYKDNLKNISCIPEGKYEIINYNSNKFKNCFKINDVINRSDILIHSGNTINDIKGCILIGKSINNEGYLSESKKALKEFKFIMDNLKMKDKVLLITSFTTF